MASLRDALDTAVYNRLSTDSALRVYPIRNGMLQANDPLPAIVFNWQDGTPMAGRTFTQRGWDAEYLVKVISESGYPKSAAEIESLVDDRLEGCSLTVANFTHVACTRMRDVSFPEHAAGGRELYHVGAMWLIREDRAL